MTTYLFAPSPTAPFQFQPTLDGEVYHVVVTWNLFGQRYYVNVMTTSGALVLCLPMIGSPPDYDISLTAGYFTSTLVWRPSAGWFEVLP